VGVVNIRYDGPIERGMVFTAPDNNGTLGFRRIRVLGWDFDQRVIFEELPSRMRLPVGDIRRIPELNLRIVFEPEAR
jgi:hypothetical protein